MEIGLFQVDAFTGELFKGNPAAVCPLFKWLPDQLMQSIAAENNLPATAFIVPQDDDYELRWFTSTKEYELCGHATLAAAFILKNVIEIEEEVFRFHTKSGLLTVRCQDDFFTLDFLLLQYGACEAHEDLSEALGHSPTEIYATPQHYLCVYDDEQIVRGLNPDFAKLAALQLPKVIVTAPGSNSCDIVSRFFTPREDSQEDAATGSAHCALTPYWTERLKKNKLHAYQASGRGGELWCELRAGRVLLTGQGKLYMKGAIEV